MKNFYLIILILLACFSCKKEPGKLSGVVTYYVSDKSGMKPDVGAKIIILQKNDSIEKQLKKIVDFEKALHEIQKLDSILVVEQANKIKHEQDLIEQIYAQYDKDKSLSTSDRETWATKRAIKDSLDAVKQATGAMMEQEGATEKESPMIKEHWAKIKNEYNVGNIDELLKLNEERNSIINNLINNSNILNYAVDGNGNYSAQVEPGKYSIVVVSVNSKIVKDSRAVIIQEVEIETGKEKTVNASF